MALLPRHRTPPVFQPAPPPRTTFEQAYLDVTLTGEEQRRLATDRRLIDGEHCEFLSQSERNRLVLLDWLLAHGRHGHG